MVSWILFVLFSSLLMGVATALEKLSLRVEHATEFSAALSPLVALLSLLFLPFASFQVTFTQLLLLAILSALSAYTFLLSARVLKHGELSVASPAFSSLPTLFIVPLAFIFLSERLTWLQYFVIAAMVAVVYLLLFEKQKSWHKPGFESSKYRYMVIFNAFLVAIGTTGSRYLLLSMDPFTFLILSGIFIAITMVMLITIRYGGIKEIAFAVKRYRNPLLVNAVLTVGYRASYYIALVQVPVSLAQPLRNTLYVVITAALAGIPFKEKEIGRKLILGMILLVLAYLLAI